MQICTKTVWENRSGKHTSWFHPRITGMGSGELLMTLQGIEGSDYFLPVQESVSTDNGETWSTPRPVLGLARRDLDNGIAEGVCDVVPEYHAPTRTVLAIGHNVYYRDNYLFDSLDDRRKGIPLQLPRFPVYSVRDSNGNWIVQRQKLEIPGMENCSIYSCGSSQRLFSGNDLYIPLTFGTWGRRDRMFRSVKCRYDGREIQFLDGGNVLELPVGRGIMEPSLCFHGERYLVTLRTEDGYGHYAVSPDGLNWGPMAPWTFDDGELAVMTNTQQHWLCQNGKLYLVYNRKLPYNQHLIRWRAPLLIAEVDPDKIALIRSTEQVAFPMMPEDPTAEFKAALYGNFHPVNLSAHESLISVSEERHFDAWRGNTLLARLSDIAKK